MTTQPKTIDDIRTWLTNSYGVSAEDAANIISGVSTFAVATYMQSDANRKPAVPQAGQGLTMETVKAYVDGRLEGITVSGHAHGTQTSLRGEK